MLKYEHTEPTGDTGRSKDMANVANSVTDGMAGQGNIVTGWNVPSPWEGLGGSYPMGETHEVLGHEVPLDVDESLLEALGSCLFLDGHGEDPTEGEGVPALPADEVAGLVEAVTAHNNGGRVVRVSHAMVARAVAISRVWRLDHRGVCEMLLRHAVKGNLPALMMAEAEQARARMQARLDDPTTWNLWEIASGEWLDLTPVEGDGTDIVLVDGGPYALTGEGERRVGTKEGVIPMWALVAECDGVDPYDCEEFLRSITFEALIDEGLVRDTLGEVG